MLFFFVDLGVGWVGDGGGPSRHLEAQNGGTEKTRLRTTALEDTHLFTFITVHIRLGRPRGKNVNLIPTPDSMSIQTPDHPAGIQSCCPLSYRGT